MLSCSILIKKRHEIKQGYPPSYFEKQHCERKNRKKYAHIMYSLNIEGPKKIWVPKVESLSCDANDDTDNCFSNHITEEINMFYFITPMLEEIHLHDNNKTKSLNL